jgi:hypothetical protein
VAIRPTDLAIVQKASIEAFLDRAALGKRGREAARRGHLRRAAWLAIDTLPSVRWKDGAGARACVL